jgi:hypothetical protein
MEEDPNAGIRVDDGNREGGPLAPYRGGPPVPYRPPQPEQGDDAMDQDAQDDGRGVLARRPAGGGQLAPPLNPPPGGDDGADAARPWADWLANLAAYVPGTGAVSRWVERVQQRRRDRRQPFGMAIDQLGAHVEENAAIGRIFTAANCRQAVNLRQAIDDRQADGPTGLGANISAADLADQRAEATRRVAEYRGVLFNHARDHQTRLNLSVSSSNACSLELLMGLELPALAIVLQYGAEDGSEKRREARMRLAAIERLEPEFAQVIRESSQFVRSQQGLLQRIRAGLPQPDGGQAPAIPDDDESLEDLCAVWDRLLAIGEFRKTSMHTHLQRYGGQLDAAFSVLAQNPPAAVQAPAQTTAALEISPGFVIDETYRAPDACKHYVQNDIGAFMQDLSSAQRVNVFSDANEADPPMQANERAPGFVPDNVRDKFSRFFLVVCEHLLRSSLPYPASPLHAMMTAKVPFDRTNFNNAAETDVLFFDYCAAQMMHDKWPEQKIIRDFMKAMQEFFTVIDVVDQPDQYESKRPALTTYATGLTTGGVRIRPNADEAADKRSNYETVNDFIAAVVLAMQSPRTPAEPEFSWFPLSNAAPMTLAAMLASVPNERAAMALGVTRAPPEIGRIPNQQIGHAGMSMQLQRAVEVQSANGHRSGMDMAQNLSTAGGIIFKPLSYLSHAPELIMRGIVRMPTGQLVANQLTDNALLKYQLLGTVSAILLVVKMTTDYAISLTLATIAGPPAWAAAALYFRGGLTPTQAMERVFALGIGPATPVTTTTVLVAEVVWVMYVAYRISAARNGAFARRIGAWWDFVKDLFGF